VRVQKSKMFVCRKDNGSPYGDYYSGRAGGGGRRWGYHSVKVGVEVGDHSTGVNTI